MPAAPTPTYRTWLTQVGSGLSDLVLDSRCAGCGDVPGRWCAACRAAAGAPRVVGSVAGLPVAAAGRYDGPLGRAVVAHKERGRLSLVHPLGDHLALAVAALAASVVAPPSSGGRPVVLVPVPSRRAVVRSRGQDHARRLAAVAARRLAQAGLPCRALPALTVVGPVQDQAGLAAADRRANVAGAFAVRSVGSGRLGGSAVVVVDDVVTTGATLDAAVAALRAGGGQVTGCAVVAAAQRKSRPALPGGPDLG